MNIHRPRASQVSVAHHLDYKSYRTQMQGFSGRELLQKNATVGGVRSWKFSDSYQEIYHYTQSPSPASSTVHTDYSDTDRSSAYSHYPSP